ncbi:MAG: alpha-galactosidase, partial [Prevotella sp.]|nr:alpha-galactosidase [Prevotella sp.]
FHQWAYQYGIRDSQKDRPVLVNNWEATHCDFDEDRLSDLFKEAHTIGAELFLLDDGWFGNGQYARNDDRHGLGDWQEDRSKLPHGLSYLVRKAKSNKIDFGIWLEPEMVNPLSNCYQTHPDWIIFQKGREPILGRHQQILDINRPEVFSFEKKIFDDVLGENKGIAYVKWDCDRFVTQPGSSYLKHSSHLLVDYTWRLYKLMDYFSNNYPNVMGMICAGGSGRVDYGSLPYFHSFWPSDNTDPMDRIKIQWGFSYFFPASTISSHVTRMGKRHLKLAIDVALSGAFGVDLNLTTASKEEKQQLKTATELYKSEIRPLVMHGLLYRLSSPYENSLAALSYVSPDKKKAVLYLYQMKEDSSRSLCLRGLDPSSTYSLREVNKLDDAVKRYEGVYSGRELMEKGLSTLLSHQYESAVIVIEKK